MARYKRRRYHSSHYVRGRGAYKFPNIFRKGTFAKYGGRLGRYIGGKSPIAPAIFRNIGGYAGTQLGKGLAKFTGTGDYHAVGYRGSGKRMARPPRYYKRAGFTQKGLNFGGQHVTVNNREMVAKVDSVAGFSNQVYDINPGLDTSFPWLSQVAKAYKKYRINSLIYSFISTSSDAIASTTNLGLGTVLMATNYDPDDGPYQSVIEANNTDHAHQTKPSNNFMHAVECKPSDVITRNKYVRTGPVPAGKSSHLYDHGKLNFITEMPTGATYAGMGQLWVTYSITFFSPTFQAQRGLGINCDRFRCTAATSAAILGTGFEVHPFNNLGCNLNSATKEIFFPPSLAEGYFMITYYSSGNATDITEGTTNFTNCSVVKWPNNHGTSENWQVAKTTGADTCPSCPMTMVVRLTGNDAKIGFGGSWVVPDASAGFCDIVIQQLNGDVFTKPASWLTGVDNV